MEIADLVFVNATVLTLDAEATVAEALAVTGNTISAVGSTAEISPLIGPATEVVDLHGGTLLPGINDSHIHAVSLGAMAPPLSLDVGYPAVRSIADVAATVGAATAHKPAGSWIRGGGWDVGYLAECRADPERQPTRHDLDPHAPSHPVLLHDFSLHTGWVNTTALRAAGIDPEADHRHDESIVTDGDGRPTGVLYEDAVRRVLSVVPPMSDDDRRSAIRSATAMLSQLGVTSITDPALGPADPHGPMGAGGIDVYRSMATAGELPVRVNVLRLLSGMAPDPAEFERNFAQVGEQPTPDPRRFQVVGTKIFADGIPPNKTAWMHDEYVGGGTGSLTVHGDTDEERVAALARMVLLAHRAGHQIGVHATGDRAADAVVDAMIAAMREHPRQDPRHYVIHADFLTPAAIAKCAEFGIGANMNPAIKWTIADLATEIVGAERSAYEWPYRSAIEGGVNVASASDAPVTLPDWRQGVSTMILRESKASGTVAGPDETIGLIDALRTYTTSAAWQDHAEDWKGSLEVGKVADLCALGADLLTIDPHEIAHVAVTMTVFDGRIVHRADRTAAMSTKVVDGPVGGHYGPSTRLVPTPALGRSCCEYDGL